MALVRTLPPDAIPDIEGAPLSREYSVLLKSLHHLMTVGTYYSLEHEQYVAASGKAAASISAGMADRSSLILEISSSGLICGSQTVPADHREVRPLYDLLVPLNVASLEIDQGVTGDDLRRTLRVLHEAHLQLGNSTGFHEIVLDGLPPTIRAVEAKLHTAGESDAPPDPDNIEDLAQRFLDLVERIVANMKSGAAADSGGGEGAGDGAFATELAELVEELKHLATLESDPRRLLQLIENAQRALDLSRDPGSVDLVFRILRRKPRENPEPKNPPKASLDEASKRCADQALVMDRLEALKSAAGERGPLPVDDSKRDYLGICFKVMLAEPSSSLMTHLKASCEIALGDPETSLEDVQHCAHWVAEALRQDRAAVCDRILDAVIRPLRAHHLEFLPTFWFMLWSLTDEDLHTELWPFLVNDVLLGVGEVPGDIHRALLEAVGSVGLHAARSRINRLYGMPAFQEDRASSRIFSVPPVKLYPLHALLMTSPLAPWHGPRLWKHLRAAQDGSLLSVIVPMLGPYAREHGGLVGDLMAQEAKGAMPEETRQAVVMILEQGLACLPPNGRQRQWVPAALDWLGRLDPETARPVYKKVLRQRRWLFLKAWPETCRSAVERRMKAWNSASAT